MVAQNDNLAFRKDEKIIVYRYFLAFIEVNDARAF